MVHFIDNIPAFQAKSALNVKRKSSEGGNRTIVRAAPRNAS